MIIIIQSGTVLSSIIIITGSRDIIIMASYYDTCLFSTAGLAWLAGVNWEGDKVLPLPPLTES